MTTAIALEPAQIEIQVSKILKTPEFKNSKVLSNFLKYIVKETLAGNEQTLKEYVIATEVLKKSSDFNPQLDAVVRIHARRLRKFLENYFSGPGAQDPIRISMPKGRYIPLFEKSTSHQIPAKKKEDQSELTIETIPTIAVLPFKNFEGNERIKVICSILCQDMTVELSHSKEIKVISNHSSEYAISHLNSNREVISHLGLDYILTGSCYVEVDQLNIYIELHQVAENQVIWAESMVIHNFESNTIKEYRSVVKKVVAMTCGYFGIIYRKTMNDHVPQDYDTLYAIYWHNRFHQNYSMEAFHESVPALDKALRINPANPLLMALKGEFYLNLCSMDAEGETDCFFEGYRLVKKAIAIDPNNQHAWQVMSWAMLLDKNMKEYDRASEKCLSLNPNNPMYMASVGFGDQCAAKYEKGFALMLESIDLNPYAHWVVNLGLSLYYFHTKSFDDALYWAQLINRPGLLWDPLLRASARGWLGQKEKANMAAKELVELSPNFSERANIIIGRFSIDPELHQTILGGLKRAGVELPSSS